MNGFRPIEYKMTAQMANNIIKEWKGKKTDKNTMLCQYVNEQLGIRGYCVNVIIYDVE